MTKKLTPWFYSPVNPAHPGIYQVQWYLNPCYAAFTGIEWMSGSWTLIEAELQTTKADNAPFKWRGLSSNPKETK